MPGDDQAYLLRRAAEERRRAEGCTNAAARASHQELADAYEGRARRGTRQAPPVGAK